MGTEFQKMIAQRQTPADTAKAIQDEWAKFDKTHQVSEASLEASAEREAQTTAMRARETPGRAAGRERKLTGQAPGEPRHVAYLYILPGLAAYLIFTFVPAAADGAAVVLRRRTA